MYEDNGFYWVKFKNRTDWIIGQYSARFDDWDIIGSDESYNTDLLIIGKKIENPYK